ncbi:MAG: RloB family protein [Coriobacteriales bacterium]|jgi:hypothetical protein|nr:RloB family protein [Coriobacteriales bacterium]
MLVTERKAARQLPYDAAWLVFDSVGPLVNGFAAITVAILHKYRLAISAPCIEYWILLHFQYTDAYLCDYRAVERSLKDYCEYDKKSFDPKIILDKTGTAVNNTRMARNSQARVPKELPATDMDLLVAQMNAMAHPDYRLFEA